MSRHLVFVLLLATVVVLADHRSEAQQAAGAAGSHAKTGAAQGRTEKAKVQTEVAQGQTQKAEAQTGAAQGQTQKSQAETGAAQERTEEAQAPTEEDPKLISVPGGKALGMSILGNQEAPKSLVIVPWKSSELGRSPGISPILDDSRQPVDKEVFMRALRYYEIRSETKR